MTEVNLNFNFALITSSSLDYNFKMDCFFIWISETKHDYDADDNDGLVEFCFFFPVRWIDRSCINSIILLFFFLFDDDYFYVVNKQKYIRIAFIHSIYKPETKKKFVWINTVNTHTHDMFSNMALFLSMMMMEKTLKTSNYL